MITQKKLSFSFNVVKTNKRKIKTTKKPKEKTEKVVKVRPVKVDRSTFIKGFINIDLDGNLYVLYNSKNYEIKYENYFNFTDKKYSLFLQDDRIVMWIAKPNQTFKFNNYLYLPFCPCIEVLGTIENNIFDIKEVLEMNIHTQEQADIKRFYRDNYKEIINNINNEKYKFNVRPTESN